jgi:hypothetical protein
MCCKFCLFPSYGTDSDTYTTDTDEDDRNLDEDFGSDYDINDVFNDEERKQTKGEKRIDNYL